MKKTSLVSAIVICLFAGMACAQPIDPDTDSIGLYFDAGATVTERDAALYAPFPVYAIATNISRDGVTGFEFRFEYTDLILSNYSLAGPGINFSTPPDFEVGCSHSLPYAEAIVLAEYTFLATVLNRIDMFLSPITSPTIPGWAAYADLDHQVVALHPSSSDWALPMAIINGGGAVVIATEEETWGGVKAMYR